MSPTRYFETTYLQFPTPSPTIAIMSASSFATTLDLFQRTQLALLCDDVQGNARGILVAPAEEIRYESVLTMVQHGAGMIYVCLSPAQARAFHLQSMAGVRGSIHKRNTRSYDLYVSVEAREGISTGISVDDRTATIRALGTREPSPRLIVSPGHIFPVATREGGVLVRQALPEGALDLVHAIGRAPAAAYVDLLDKNGSSLPVAEQQRLAKDLQIPFINLEEITRFRLETEQLVYRVAETKIPTHFGTVFSSYVYRSRIHDGEHLALVKGEISRDVPILTRVQPEFTFGDVFGGGSPPSRAVLHRCLELIRDAQNGVCIYLRRPDKHSLRDQVIEWQKRYQDRSSIPMREYGLGAQILRDLGVGKINLLTNSKRSLVGIHSFGIEIVDTTPISASLASTTTSNKGTVLWQR